MDALSDRVVDLETKTQPNKQIAALKRYEKDNNFEVNMITRCTRGDARSFFLYLQNVFVCTKENVIQ